MTATKKSKKKTAKKSRKKKAAKKKKPSKNKALKRNNSRNKKRNKISDAEFNAPVNLVKVRNIQKIEVAKSEVITEETKRRIDWQRNHQLVESAYWDLTQLYNKFPTIMEVAEHAQLSDRTVEKHMKEFSISDISINFKPEFMIERVLIGLATGGAGGDARAGMAFIQALSKLGFVKEKEFDQDRPDWRDVQKEIKVDKKISTMSRMERIHNAILADNAIN